MRKTARFAARRAQGFTLVELLVVIAIIAILAAVVVLIINPLELTRRSRDAARLTDLANLQQAINVAVQEATNSGSQILCNGANYPCYGNSVTDSRLSDGSGWIKVNLGTQQSVSVPTLPIDAINKNDAANNFHYIYCADKPTGQVDGWEINAKLESAQQADKMDKDGGDDPALYEVGSNLKLVGPTGSAAATCTY